MSFKPSPQCPPTPITQNQRDRAMLDPKPHWNQRERPSWLSSQDSLGAAHKQKLQDSIYWFENRNLKKFTQNEWQLRWNNILRNKLQSIKAEIGEWKEGYRKSRREEIILSFLRIGHTEITHSYLLKQEQQPWCVGCHFIFSKIPIDRLYWPYTKMTIILNCKQYKRTIQTCWSRQDTSI